MYIPYNDLARPYIADRTSILVSEMNFREGQNTIMNKLRAKFGDNDAPFRDWSQNFKPAFYLET